ncbi:MAG: hypothetical protein H7066_02960 [Cytophagaceae bacterium]|nr:hypothetical protein [Gemmatimonadaceae bacterium]
MKKWRKEGARESADTQKPAPTPKQADKPREDATGDARESFSEDTRSDQGTIGDAMDTRVRHRQDERLRLDALDDIEVSRVRDDLPADAVDEIAMSASPEEYETTDSGDRRAKSDEAEMGFGGEAHSADELADQVLGHESPRARGTTRDGEPRGLHLGLE